METPAIGCFGQDELDILRKCNEQLKAEKAQLEGELKQQRELTKVAFLTARFVDLPAEFQNDKAFIMLALENEKVSWYGLPQKWKEDVEIASFLFERNHKPLSYDDCQFRETNYCVVESEINKKLKWIDLPYDLKMDEKLLLLALQTYDGSPRWTDLPKWHQTNTEVIVTALIYRRLSFKKVPIDMQQSHPEIAFFGIRNDYLKAENCPCLDQTFYKNAIEQGRLKWCHLPESLKSDASFVNSLNHIGGGTLAQILEHVPEIGHDRSFWSKLVEEETLGKNLLKFAPSELFSDQAFMLQMIKACAKVFLRVDGSLRDDNAFLKAALSKNPMILEFLSSDEMERHRSTIIKTVPRIHQVANDDSSYVLYKISNNIGDTLWRDPEFVSTWLEAGHGVPERPDVFLVLRQIPELCLINAIHCRQLGSNDISCLRRDDPVFMRKAMNSRPTLFRYAQGAARSNPEIMTMAFAGCPKTAEDEMMSLHFEERDDEIQDYLDYLKEKLSPFKIFWRHILGNMLSTQSVETTGTNLTLLNQGLETSCQYKKQLAAYLGVPTGKWLQRLQQAEQNVLMAIAPVADRFTHD